MGERDPYGDGPRRRSRTSPDRVQRSFYLPRDLVDRARAAVHATASEPGESHNLSELAGRVLAVEVSRLEERYNAGRPFPPVASVPPGPGPAGIERIRNGVLRRGRP
jgi:centromere-binding protein ParB